MMIKIGRIQAIQSLIPDSGVYGYEDNPSYPDGYTGIIPTESEITQEIARLQAAHDSNQYQRDRVLEYPSIGDQLDMIYHSGLGGPEFQEAIKAVKDAHPKGGN